MRAVLTKYHINLEDLPPAEDVTACTRYRPKLCRSYFLKPCENSDYFWEGESDNDDAEDRMAVDSDREEQEEHHDDCFLVCLILYFPKPHLMVR